MVAKKHRLHPRHAFWLSLAFTQINQGASGMGISRPKPARSIMEVARFSAITVAASCTFLRSTCSARRCSLLARRRDFSPFTNSFVFIARILWIRRFVFIAGALPNPLWYSPQVKCGFALCVFTAGASRELRIQVLIRAAKSCESRPCRVRTTSLWSRVRVADAHRGCDSHTAPARIASIVAYSVLICVAAAAAV